VEAGRLLWGISNRGTKAKRTCDNAFVTNIVQLPLRFRTENICCCRYAFAQKTFVADASLSHRKHLLAKAAQQT